jgi:pimeloyl-ACP methyl ester carboxylesterase
MQAMEKRDFVITNRNGKRMPATLRMPGSAPKGTFVVLHGLGGWKEQGVVAAMADAVCTAGHIAVTFDAADGAMAPDSDPLVSTTTGYREDLEDVIAYAKEQDWHAAPLSLAGHSQGALVALEYARIHAGLERLILAASAISWRTYTKFVIPLGFWLVAAGSHNTPGPSGRSLRLGRPWLFDFMGYDGYRSAPHVSVPTLVISAGYDDLVGREKVHARLAKRLPNAVHESIPGAPHTFRGHESAVAATITAWLSSS